MGGKGGCVVHAVASSVAYMLNTIIAPLQRPAATSPIWAADDRSNHGDTANQDAEEEMHEMPDTSGNWNWEGMCHTKATASKSKGRKYSNLRGYKSLHGTWMKPCLSVESLSGFHIQCICRILCLAGMGWMNYGFHFLAFPHGSNITNCHNCASLFDFYRSSTSSNLTEDL